MRDEKLTTEVVLVLDRIRELEDFARKQGESTGESLKETIEGLISLYLVILDVPSYVTSIVSGHSVLRDLYHGRLDTKDFVTLVIDK
ncbi:MAG TPA: hypothetical protein PKD68_00420 [Candidatus Saccharibacteria bacterium]|nr:hypothetical protein [Candidatus Saccharibacteria bacterium]